MARPMPVFCLSLLGAALLVCTLSLPPAEGAPVPISYGQTMAGAISAEAEQDTFTFMAAAGGVILIRVTTESFFMPQITLYDPAGSPIATTTGAGPTLIELKQDPMPVDGYYQVTVADYNGTGTGTYWIFLQRLNNPGLAVTMVFGEVRIGTLTSPCEIKTFVFDALQGDVAWMRVNSEPTLDPEIILFGPTGDFVTGMFDASPLDHQITLTAPGICTLAVKDVADEIFDPEACLRRHNAVGFFERRCERGRQDRHGGGDLQPAKNSKPPVICVSYSRLRGVEDFSIASEVDDGGVTPFPLFGGQGYRLDRCEDLIDDTGEDINPLPVTFCRKITGDENQVDIASLLVGTCRI